MTDLQRMWHQRDLDPPEWAIRQAYAHDAERAHLAPAAGYWKWTARQRYGDPTQRDRDRKAAVEGDGQTTTTE